jgi:hypothetical protein
MDFLGVLIFIVIAIASMAQKLQEARAENNARRATQNKSKPGEVSDATRKMMFEGKPGVAVAKAKGTLDQVAKVAASPDATGKELIEALFGEGSADTDDGWEDVHPEHRPVPTRQQQKISQHNDPAHAREAAQRQREKMEHERSRGHALHGGHASNEQARAAAEERKRKQVLAERERRKQQAIEQQKQASKARSQRAARTRAIVAPVAQEGFIPRNLNDVRRGLVMAEILGKPKAFE